MYGYQGENGGGWWDELEDFDWHVYTVDAVYKIDN